MTVSTINDTNKESVIIIGTGSVATHFINHLLSIGTPVIQQYGRSKPIEPKVPFTNNPKELRTDASYYIISVSDDAIDEVSQCLPRVEGIVVHTAGSVGIDIFESRFKNYGVLYPLQSFSNNRTINMLSVPFLIEGNSDQTEIKLLQFAKKISNNVCRMSYQERIQIHLAAVFACNFSNYMNTIAEELLKNKNIDFSLLKPLLQETFEKILTAKPEDVQTGPAKRNDKEIIEKHLKMLTNNPNFQEIYKLVSKSIADLYKK